MRLAFQERGAGPAVVLLHGFPLSSAMWERQLDALSGAYRVIAPDLRGHGASPAPEGVSTMDAMADDVIELLDSLGLTEPIVLGGLSMGGYVALALIAHHPERVRGLVLMDTRPNADAPEAARTREATAQAVLASNSTREVVEAMVPKLFAPKSLAEQAERVATMRAAMERNSPEGVAAALRGMAARPDRSDDLRRFAAPVLVIVGEHDAITPPEVARSMAALVSGTRLEIVPDAGHMAPFEAPAATNTAILQFLGELGH